MAPAHDLIDWLFAQQLQVDEEWAVRDEQGFTWWADRQAQRVEVRESHEGGADSDSSPHFLLSVRTEFLCQLELTDQAAVTINSCLLPYAALCGPVYDAEKKTLELCSLVRVSEEVTPFLKRAVSLACLLQIEEARVLGPGVAQVLMAHPTVSGHPEHGLREDPDALARGLLDVLSPHAYLPCPITGEDFEEAVETFMQEPPALSATAEDGFSVEFPFGRDSSSFLSAIPNKGHPRYGQGLLLLQSFVAPLMDEAEGARLALLFNEAELTCAPLGYGLGSYHYLDGVLHFASFLPNLLLSPEILPHLYYAAAHRARELSCGLTRSHPGETSPGPAPGSGVEAGEVERCDWCGGAICPGNAMITVNRHIEQIDVDEEHTEGIVTVIQADVVLTLCAGCGNGLNTDVIREMLMEAERE
jgi:hypothetical protein